MSRYVTGASRRGRGMPPPAPAPTSPWVWILGTLVALGVVGTLFAAYIINRVLTFVPKGPSPEIAGYSWLPKCGGVVVIDEAKAMEYAYTKGQQSTPFDVTNPTAWLVTNVAALGTAYCDLASFPVSSLGFVYRLFRSYIFGAEKAGKMPVGLSIKLISGLRDEVKSRGVPVAELPEA